MQLYNLGELLKGSEKPEKKFFWGDLRENRTKKRGGEGVKMPFMDRTGMEKPQINKKRG